ncbi:MAG: DUF4403 family protein, partial [Verrucomicrobiota bacterium]
MKKFLLLSGIIVFAILIALPIATRVLGPKIIVVPPPSGEPIGEFDSPRPETSLLAVNIAIPIEMMNQIANEKAPESFSGAEQKNFHKRIKRGRYAWEAARGEISFANTGSSLRISAPFAGGARLQGEVDAKIINLPVDTTAELAGTVGGTLSPSFQPNWQIDPQLVPELNLSRAQLDIAGLGKIDISGLLGGELGQFLQKELRKLTPAIRKQLNFRGEINKLWQQAYLSRLVNDDPRIWLSITPQQVFLAPVDYSRTDEISVMVGIESETFLTNRDPGQPTPAPLP